MWFKRNWRYLLLALVVLVAFKFVADGALNYQTDSVLRDALCTPDKAQSWECEPVRLRWW
jgi:hypothetical protein